MQDSVEIRMIQESDAVLFMNLNMKLDRETRFMMLEPDERSSDPDYYAKQIRDLLSSKNSMIFVVDTGSELVGYIGLFGGRFKKILHSAHIVIGIVSEYRGKGLGKALFEISEQWAKDVGVSRLELTVVTANEPAVALYKKRGFETEGVKKNSLFIDGEFVDEYYMGKILSV